MAALLEAQDIFFQPFEPKLSNRGIMLIEGIPIFLIKGFDRPSPESGVVELPHINVMRKTKGKTTWGDVSFTMYDPIVPSGAQTIMEWVRLEHESVTGRDGYSDFYKKDVTIQLLGPVGDIVEEWTLKGAFPTSVTMNSVDWGGADPIEINVTLAIDYAVLQF
jgi:hypothetical protein